MSNDEAIKILEHLRDACATFNIDDHSDEEALDIAINAIKELAQYKKKIRKE